LEILGGSGAQMGVGRVSTEVLGRGGPLGEGKYMETCKKSMGGYWRKEDAKALVFRRVRGMGEQKLVMIEWGSEKNKEILLGGRPAYVNEKRRNGSHEKTLRRLLQEKTQVGHPQNERGRS